jgi:hypothetical protein
MNHPWAVHMAASAAPAAAELRMEAGIEVLEGDDSLWLRGKSCDERIDVMLRRLPGATRYEVLSDTQLLPEGKRLPSGRLPGGTWVAIKSWAALELPVATLAAQCGQCIAIRLEPVSASDEPDLLVGTLADWSEYATRAPQVRLERLTFAASADSRAIVRGRPLPPLPGTRYYERAGVAVPCGWGWPSWLTAELVRAALDIETGAVALFSPAGTWEEIPADQFVRATRSAVRLTVEGTVGPGSATSSPGGAK